MMSDNNLNRNIVYDSMLTTIDNPFNPFTQFDEWFEYDSEKGYDTNNYLARIVKSSDDLTEEDEALAIEQAIDEIIRMNTLGIYIKVTPDTFVDRSKPIDTA
jgi:hypothetical protein